LDQERKMDALVENEKTGVDEVLDGMTRWAIGKWKTLLSVRQTRNQRVEPFVYAVRLDRSTFVSRTYSGLEIKLKADSDAVFWPDFYDTARKHRSVVGVFDADGKVLLEYQVAPRGWDQTTEEAIIAFKKELVRIGVDPDDL
jgi:hypothetical protein